ncbi:24068_t:CDS:2 [Cetraspora pellucida]|uniref:24068_t:CDS:1 n=1 Tax=Cetraspora pellucida TaxID=1433469 RepID=A0A9N8VTV3_9GLOM|nr:24068_t:CDS:2 [Cetraspora pellucida]
MLLRLSSKAKKSKTILGSIVTNVDTLSGFESYDLTILDTNANEEKDGLGFTEDYNNDYEEHSTNESLSDDDSEYEYNYGIFIKLENGTTLPAKWYSSRISTVDELLSEIHINIETLTKRKSIESSDYHIAFKPEKATGAVTQLVDNHSVKENHIEITFMMLSVWASEIQPVYSGQYYILSPFYNPFISYFPSQNYGLPQMPIQSLQSIIKPTIQDFLKYVDECEVIK